MTNVEHQTVHSDSVGVRRSPLLAKLKGLVNGVNPRWGFSTVTVSDSTGDIVSVDPWRGWLRWRRVGEEDHVRTARAKGLTGKTRGKTRAGK